MSEHSIVNIISKASDCLDDSVLLLAEKSYDAALNRSYYAMFHSIQALLFTTNYAAKSHSGAHNAFHKHFILSQKLPRDLGLALKRTFEKRQFGDYDYDEVLFEDAEESVEDARYFFEATILYLKENNFLK